MAFYPFRWVTAVLGVLSGIAGGMLLIMVLQAMRFGAESWANTPVGVVCASVLCLFAWRVYADWQWINNSYERIEELEKLISDRSADLWQHWIPLADETARTTWEAVRDRGLASGREKFSVSLGIDEDPIRSIRSLEQILAAVEQCHTDLSTLRERWGHDTVAFLLASTHAGEQALMSNLDPSLREISLYLVGSREGVNEVWTRLREAHRRGEQGDSKDWYRLEIFLDLTGASLERFAATAAPASETPDA